MRSILLQIKTTLSAALSTAFGDSAVGVDPLVHVAGDPKFGDYQCNVAMGLGKKLGQKPRAIAQKIVEALSTDESSMLLPPQIAGPGFINLHLKDEFLQKALESIPPGPSEQSRNPLSPRLCRGIDRLGIDPVDESEKLTVVVDYSSPNVAKQMHVGHLRSTVIGDTIARVLEFEGHDVIRQNHIGDWGTQFGIILEALYDRGLVPRDLSGSYHAWGKLPHDPGELEDIYRAGHARMADSEFAERARRAVTRLQSGNESEINAWRHVTSSSMSGVVDVYVRLGVMLTEKHTRGESFYNPLLADVVDEIRLVLNEGEGDQSRDRKGADDDAVDAERKPLPHGRGSDQGDRSDALRAVCRVDQGAVCVFVENSDGTPAFKGPKGDPLPIIIQKSDGAFLYSTTDLAALYFRINDNHSQPITMTQPGLRNALRAMLEQNRGTLVDDSTCDKGGLGSSRILYVVGAPQKLHFEMLFATVRALGWTRPGDGKREVQLEHVSFGSVLGDDRKMLRTRTGENVKLTDLLDEAIHRAETLLRTSEADPAKRRGFDEEEMIEIAETIGIAAVKYADLSQNRNSDYVFSWDKMLALQGNTAPYMLYAYARIRSIYRKGQADRPFDIDVAQAAIRLEDAAERNLAISILRFPEIIDDVADCLLPNHLCDYLYDIAGRFMVFYESCPVLKAADAETYASRLRLCDLTARALKIGLGLLGINTLQRM